MLMCVLVLQVEGGGGCPTPAAPELACCNSSREAGHNAARVEGLARGGGGRHSCKVPGALHGVLSKGEKGGGGP